MHLQLECRKTLFLIADKVALVPWPTFSFFPSSPFSSPPLPPSISSALPGYTCNTTALKAPVTRQKPIARHPQPSPLSPNALRPNPGNLISIMTKTLSSSPLPPLSERLKEIFYAYFKLGYTTFGGPAAHIGILYGEVVEKRRWIASDQFTELFAICQALPGPASTELAYSLALVRSGFLASIFAFLLWR